MNKDDKILVTGGHGLVGGALVRILKEQGYSNILAPRSSDVDLLNWDDTQKYFADNKPDYVFHIAATVYGVLGNKNNQGWSFYSNSLMNLNVVECCNIHKVKKIIAMGSGCVYPNPAPKLPLTESDVFMGEPNANEKAYAHAKRALMTHLETYNDSYGLDYAYIIGSNMYGINDKFNTETGHVIPSLIKKCYEAKQNNTKLSVWGDGSAVRDFTYADDAAHAMVLIANNYSGSINLASGITNTIKDVVDILSKVAGIENLIEWDSTKPNGQAYRAYDLSKLQGLGFKPETSLEQGLKTAYNWYADNHKSARS